MEPERSLPNSAYSERITGYPSVEELRDAGRIEHQTYFPLDKVLLQMPRQFWTAQGLSGFTAHGSDIGAILVSWRMKDRVAVTLADAERVFPGA